MSKIIVVDKERKGYKFQLMIPNNNIERQLTKIVGSCRYVWNKALALVKQDDEDYSTIMQMSKMNGGDVEGITGLFKFNPYNQLSAMLPIWKRESDTWY